MPESIFEELKSEHQEVQQMMRQLAERYDRAMFERFGEEIERHMEAEENVLYQRLRNEESARALVLEGIEEHRVAEEILGKLQRQNGGTEEWSARMKVLMDSVEHHVQEEENELFPEARKVIREDEAVRMAEEFESAKKRVRTHA